MEGNERYVRTPVAARALGMSDATFRKWLSRRLEEGWAVNAPRKEWPDARTPLRDLDVICEARRTQKGDEFSVKDAFSSALNYSPPFPAAFHGTCGFCLDTVLEGDTIRMSDGLVVCEDCYEEEVGE